MWSHSWLSKSLVDYRAQDEAHLKNMHILGEPKFNRHIMCFLKNPNQHYITYGPQEDTESSS